MRYHSCSQDLNGISMPIGCRERRGSAHMFCGVLYIMYSHSLFDETTNGAILRPLYPPQFFYLMTSHQQSHPSQSSNWQLRQKGAIPIPDQIFGSQIPCFSTKFWFEVSHREISTTVWDESKLCMFSMCKLSLCRTPTSTPIIGPE